ncbi:MAG: hypothetical protein ACOCRO_11185 [Halanaerobiales bacterium]
MNVRTGGPKMKFNINDYVKVKLTDKGNQVLKNQHYLLNRLTNGLFGEYEEKETDENGYTKFQMHELFTVFSGYIRPGEMILPFETNIIICEKEGQNNES